MADPNSQSNITSIITNHISLDLRVDFGASVLRGFAVFDVASLQDGVTDFVLDTKDLKISKVEDKHTRQPLKFELGAAHPVFGSALSVKLPAPLKKGETLKDRVVVHYETSPNSSAIQWLLPEQTAGKEHPYLFTQCQAIHARALLPCQDAPGRKVTYSAVIRVPSPLTALMSAVAVGSALPDLTPNTLIYTFKQPVPICTYLIALAVGALESREIGPRTRVWSEKSMVDAGAFEFAETEEFIQVAEKVLGCPYLFSNTYDVLLLPPSFPYGGMENPNLTFCTPTLLAGDRSLADVVAHEISHSWTGNLVTNQTWEHFWLNEGFTVYTERRIAGNMYGEKVRHLKSIVGYKQLQRSVEQFGADSPLTALVPKLDGVDPDDAFSSVPYEKGFALLYYLETVVGGVDKFEKFLHSYINTFRYQSITTEDFKQHFLKFFTPLVDASVLNKIEWDVWFNKPGMPPVELHFDESLSNASQQLCDTWLKGGANATKDDIKGWHTDQIVVFLDKLQAASTKNPLSVDTLKHMDSLYNFTVSRNSEIINRWYELCIASEHAEVFPHVVTFLTSQGRMKFVRPLYRALGNSTKGRELAVNTFKQHHKIYHSIAQKMIAKDLNVQL